MRKRRYEGSRADIRQDKAAARRLGIPVSKYEGSPADKKLDVKGQNLLNKQANKIAFKHNPVANMAFPNTDGNNNPVFLPTTGKPITPDTWTDNLLKLEKENPKGTRNFDASDSNYELYNDLRSIHPGFVGEKE